MPCLDGIIYFFLTLGAKLGDKIGVRNSIIITLALQYLSYFILIFAENLFIFLLSMIIFGIAHAISNLAVIKNCWKYFPNYRDLIFGIIVSGAGICSSIITPLADFLFINPQKEGIEKKTKIYSKNIANRFIFRKYLTIVSVILSILGGLSVFFTFDKKEEEAEEIIKEKEENIKNSQKNALIEPEKEQENKEIERESIPDFNGIDDTRPSVIGNNIMLGEAFLSKKNIMLICFCFCSFCK